MNLEQQITQHFQDSAQLKLDALEQLRPHILAGAVAMAEAIRRGNKVMVCGNGGSAADSQHFAAEFLNRLEMERGELAAMSLTTDTSTLTSIANDYSYDEIFSKQVRALGKPGDILFAITTSGNSKNVLKAVEVAHARQIQVIALTGRDGGKMTGVLAASDVHICVPHERTLRIQEVHILVIHCFCDLVDTILFGDK
jgi:D-sedoheptulose 7-phosphate isomerase